MSLQELPGSTIHLKLSIREGHGFGFLKSPVVIVACINGISLETEVVPASPDPLFHIDLVWETDKWNLRRFRASNTPLKIECFTVNPNSQREGIGSILLNVKSAQVVVGGSHKSVSEKWHRLIGVPPEAKALQPELLLSLTIQEPNSFSQPMLGSSLASGKSTSFEKTESATVGSVPKALPVLEPFPEFRQGYILLGPENVCFDMFFLTFKVKRAHEFELLLQSDHRISDSGRNSKSFEVLFSLMGHSIKTRDFEVKYLEKEYQINEEVVLPLRTSLPIINSYLQKSPCAGLSLLCLGQEVAASELHLRALVPTIDSPSFIREFGGKFELNQNCVLVSSSSGTIPSNDGREPNIEIATRLQLSAPLTASQKPISKTNCPKSISDSLPHPCAEESFPSRSESRQSQDTFIVTSQSGPVWVPVAPGPIQCVPQISKTDIDAAWQEGSIVNSTTVKLIPSKIEFYQNPKAPGVRFLFECAGSSVTTSKLTDISITQNLSLVKVEGIYASVSSQPEGCIQIHVFWIDVKSPNPQHFASARVSFESLKLQNKKEESLSSELMGPLSQQSLGVLHFSVIQDVKQLEKRANTLERRACLETNSINLSPNPPHVLNSNSEIFTNRDPKPSSTVCTKDPVQDNLTHNQSQKFPCNTSVDEREPSQKLFFSSDVHIKSPLNEGLSCLRNQCVTHPIMPLDSGTAYKIVEELEDWKEKQQEIFLAGLKEKEREHIAKITDEWTSQTKAQNTELDRKMEECKTLAESLCNAKQDLRDRLKTCAIREQELRRAKEELDLQYNIKFHELTLAAKQLDESVKLKVALAETKLLKLEEKIKELESENDTLRHKLSQMSSHHSDNQMCGMSHGQVSQLLSQVDQLEGKLKDTIQSKAYFKEKWGRAVREMNQAKLQFAQTAGSNRCLENLLGKEEEELQNDQRTLEQLRQEIAHLNT